MLQAYYSGSGLGLTEYDACASANPPAYCSTTSWWDRNGGFIVTLIGGMIEQYGTRMTTDQANKEIKRAISESIGGSPGAPSQADIEKMTQQIMSANPSYTYAQARAIVTGTVGNGIPSPTALPSWLLPAGIGLVLFVLLQRKGGA